MSVDNEMFKTNTQYKETVDIFPSLQKYKEKHSTLNFQKVCVELSQFCKDLYASTQNEEEREIYFNMLDKLNRK